MKIYHHNDADGRCAGAIALKIWKQLGQNPEVIEIDYKDQLDIDSIKIGETLIIVDFSFKLEIMEKIRKKTSGIIWIDHHKTAKDYPYQELHGLRDFSDGGKSGCELTWEFFKGKETDSPMAIKLIGDYDTWQFKFGEKSEFMNLGIKLYPHQPKDEIWAHLLSTNHEEDLDILLNEGKICRTFRDMICSDYAKAQGFETEFDGHKTFAMGLYMFGSKAFGQKIKEYPLCISFEFDGKNYTIGLYSEQIDVGDLAKKYGGGGHKWAAGFVSNELPFSRMSSMSCIPEQMDGEDD